MTKVLVPAGALGLGFDAAALARGVEKKPDIICIDGGSTDSGPFYLGSGTSKYSRSATKAEWKQLMQARAKASVPLVIGSAGTCGTDATVDWMYDITCEIAKELGQRLKVVRIYSSQAPSEIATALENGLISPLSPDPGISVDQLTECSNIVALAGAEQIGAAIEAGADIVIAGRTTDTAVISALPLLRGDHSGSAWHGAKIGECGAICSTMPGSGVLLIEFDKTGFTVAPASPEARCTPHSVSAHMLYENSDPFHLYEPGGCLDVTKAHYSAIDNRTVRVEGANWIPSDIYTVKLEGARKAGCQTTIMTMIRDARYVDNVQDWAAHLERAVRSLVGDQMGLKESDYDLEFRLIGVNSVFGELERRTSLPVEVGILGIINADTQEICSEIGKIANPFLLHLPLSEDEPLVSFAFPFSPAQSDRGMLYEFCLNHVMALKDPMSAFRFEMTEVGHA